MFLRPGRIFWRCKANAFLGLALLSLLPKVPDRSSSPGSPTLSVRNAHSMIYDGDQRSVILFGGADATHVCGDTWRWNSEERAWQFVTTDGPGPRTFAAFAYDERRHEGILFGGNRVLFGTGHETDSFLGDTWRFQNNRWTEIPVSGPGKRAEAAIAYERNRARIVLFGGYRRIAGATERLGDTWEWDGKRWKQVSTTGPPPRNSASMTYDEHRDRVVLFGGPGPSNETWEWDGRAWTQRQAGDVPGRFNPVMTYDAGSGQVLRFGGWTGSVRAGDTWALSLKGWSLLDVAGPPPRNHSAMVFDRLRQRAVLFGGHDGENVFGDTWEWDGTAWALVASVPSEKFVDNGH
jgi:Galactose oxidase, central domain